MRNHHRILSGHTIAFIVFVLSTAMSGCELTGDISTPKPPTATLSPTAASIPMQTISKGAPLGDDPAEPFYAVITTAKEWNDLEGRVPESVQEAGRTYEPKETEILLLAIAGVKGTSGYAITIQDVRIEGGQVIVQLSETAPGPDEIVEPASTLPFHLVAITLEALPKEGFMIFSFQDDQGGILGQQEISPP